MSEDYDVDATNRSMQAMITKLKAGSGTSLAEDELLNAVGLLFFDAMSVRCEPASYARRCIELVRADTHAKDIAMRLLSKHMGDLERRNDDLMATNNAYRKRYQDAEAEALRLQKALREAITRHSVSGPTPLEVFFADDGNYGDF